MLTLGLDWAAEMAAELGGDLHDATFTKTTNGAYDVDDPTGPPGQTQATYTCKAIALGVSEDFVDGEEVRRGDFKVLVLLGTIRDADDEPAIAVPVAGDSITVPPPTGGAANTVAVIAILSISAASVTVQVRGKAV